MATTYKTITSRKSYETIAKQFPLFLFLSLLFCLSLLKLIPILFWQTVVRHYRSATSRSLKAVAFAFENNSKSFEMHGQRVIKHRNKEVCCSVDCASRKRSKRTEDAIFHRILIIFLWWLRWRSSLITL